MYLHRKWVCEKFLFCLRITSIWNSRDSIQEKRPRRYRSYERMAEAETQRHRLALGRKTTEQMIFFFILLDRPWSRLIYLSHNCEFPAESELLSLSASTVIYLTLRPRIWFIAADSFSVHSETTLALCSFMYSINAFSGFLMWGFFDFGFFCGASCSLKTGWWVS